MKDESADGELDMDGRRRSSTGGTRVVLLGTGTPNPDPDRMGPSTAVVVGDRAYLVDFGPGVVRRAEQARRMGIEAVGPSRIEVAFATHLHSDHTAGYADLALSPWVLGRGRPVRVYGPPGLSAMTDHLLAAYHADRLQRIHGPEPRGRRGFGAVAEEIEPGVCYEDDRVRVSAFAVNHGETWSAYGYRFEAEDRTVVVSGDTAPDPRLEDACRGADLLVHEVYSDRGIEGLPEEWRRYHARMHTSASELAALASRVRPGLLVLSHLLMWSVSEEELLAEVRAGYDGEVMCGEDLGVY